MSSRDLTSVQSYNRSRLSKFSVLPKKKGKKAYPVLVVLVQVDTARLRLPPVFGYTFVDVRLVNYSGDQLW